MRSYPPRPSCGGPPLPSCTRRELDVLVSLCRPALSEEAFVTPASPREIAQDMVVSEAAVKQHLVRLYQKFRVPAGSNRRTRLANAVIALGLRAARSPSTGQGRCSTPTARLSSHCWTPCSALPADGRCGSIHVAAGHSSGGWASAEENAARASAQQKMQADRHGSVGAQHSRADPPDLIAGARASRARCVPRDRGPGRPAARVRQAGGVPDEHRRRRGERGYHDGQRRQRHRGEQGTDHRPGRGDAHDEDVSRPGPAPSAGPRGLLRPCLRRVAA